MHLIRKMRNVAQGAMLLLLSASLGRTQTTISGPITANETITDKLSITTTGAVPVSNNANVSFEAGEKIELAPGFSVARGCVFRAFIGSPGGGTNVATTMLLRPIDGGGITYSVSPQNLSVSATISGSPTPAAGAITFTVRGPSGTSVASVTSSVAAGQASGIIVIPAGTPASPTYYTVTATYAATTYGAYTWSACNGSQLLAIRTQSIPTTTTMGAVPSTIVYSPNTQYIYRTATYTASPPPPNGVINFWVVIGNQQNYTSYNVDSTGSAAGVFAVPGGTPAGSSLFLQAVGYNNSALDTSTNYGWSISRSPGQSVTVIQATPQITWATPVPITYGMALGGAQLSATASVPGKLTYDQASGSVFMVGKQTLTVAFSPTDSRDYTAASSTVTLEVDKATPLGLYASKNVPAPYTIGAQDLSAIFINPNNLSVAQPSGNVTYSRAAGTTLPAGTYTITASYPGDGNYVSTTVSATYHVLNPLTDTDGDGIPDAVEQVLGTDKNSSTPQSSSNGNVKLDVQTPR